MILKKRKDDRTESSRSLMMISIIGDAQHQPNSGLWNTLPSLKCFKESQVQIFKLYTTWWKDGVLEGHKRPICGVCKLRNIAWIEESERCSSYLRQLGREMQKGKQPRMWPQHTTCGHICITIVNQKPSWNELTCDHILPFVATSHLHRALDNPF